jgi:NAD(P)-dependent dehydrogenase (short-subunit alcohol dehydrogenase family)
MHLFDLSGRVAIVTGSSRGIGRAIAERLAEHGANVVISSRKRETCEAVALAINTRLGRPAATAIAANISSKAELETLVARTHEAVGAVSVLVCNAATNPYYGALAGIGDEQFRKILDNNILSNHWLIQLCAPDMIAARDGAIIIVSSIAGLRAMDGIGAYGVSKAADMQLARNYALEHGPHNVRVNCIAPGLIKTDFARALWEDPVALARHMKSSPLRRIGEPDDIAGAAVFLASGAGRFVTGQTLVVDGGDTIR